MANQPRLDTYEASRFFPDGAAARQPVAGTIARGELVTNMPLVTGRHQATFVETWPVKLEPDLVAQGQKQFRIFCVYCHGETGTGDGMVVERGFPAPPSYHTQRLREMPIGQIYSVISEGSGRMPQFATRVSVEDRWAIVSYVRALQLSQHAQRDVLSSSDQQELRKVSE